MLVVSNLAERSKMWIDYGLIEDWRQLVENVSSGLPNAEAKLEEAQSVIDRMGNKYLSKRARDKSKSGRSIGSDPYRREWLPIDFGSVCRELGWTEIYDQAYRMTSDAIHWSPRTLFLQVEFVDDAPTGFRHNDTHSALNSLFIGYWAFDKLIRCVSAKFQLEREQEIDSLLGSFNVLVGITYLS